MSRKLLTWVANLVLACVLVVLAAQPIAYAQDEAALSEEEGNQRSLSVPLRGTAVIQSVGHLVVSPPLFDTGLLDVGQSSQHTVSLSHQGSAESPPVQINAVSLFGVDTTEYVSDFSGYVTLYPGDSIPINIDFTPLAPGKKNAGIRLDVDGASAPHIILIKGQARYPLTSDLDVTVDFLDFGTLETNAAAKKSITLTNIATEPDAPLINVMAAGLSGDTPDAFTSQFNTAMLAPGESMNFTAEMKSPTAGHKEANLTIEHNGYNNAVVVELSGEVIKPAAVPVNFTASSLAGATITRGTSLQFGPDGKLYVTQMNGEIHIYSVQRLGADNYKATLSDKITSISSVTNHNDDGVINNGINSRLVTGILVVGSAANPVIYVQSSDPRQGGGPSGVDKNLDTNSGILHRLTKNGNNWNKLDLVRGLPRSEENHHGNGMAMLGDKLLMSQGGNTNMGAPSNNFAQLTEYALSSAILEFDLNALGNSTYDLPTLDDQDRAGVNDANDPFGGNNGKNQAKLTSNGPVQIYAPGFRNAYDLVLTEAGRLYTVDNGPNAGWGSVPTGNCTNNTANAGSTYKDGLHFIKNKGHYGGHPNPTRGNKANTFNPSNPQTPIEGAANSTECPYKTPQQQDGALTLFDKSTNGIDEYTASNFGGQMEGDLIIAAMGANVFRLQMSDAGNSVTSKSILKNKVGAVPLDLTVQGDAGPFPGTIWVVDNSVKYITVLEPDDY